MWGRWLGRFGRGCWGEDPRHPPWQGEGRAFEVRRGRLRESRIRLARALHRLAAVAGRCGRAVEVSTRIPSQMRGPPGLGGEDAGAVRPSRRSPRAVQNVGVQSGPLKRTQDFWTDPYQIGSHVSTNLSAAARGTCQLGQSGSEGSPEKRNMSLQAIRSSSPPSASGANFISYRSK